MALTKVNRLFERPGRVEIFLALAPTTDPLAAPTGVAATDNPLRLKALYELFYTDGLIRNGLKAGVSPWANVEASGITVKTKGNPVEVDPNSGAKHVIGYADFEQSIDFSIIDADVAHLADVTSARSQDRIATAAATGTAGRDTLLLGGVKTPQLVVALLRMPSVLVPGEYDNRLAFRAAFTLESEEKFSKKDAVVVKVGLSVRPDAFMVDADGTGYMAALDNAIAAAL